MHDVIIIGAGPAGLSAALVLGRCRRRVLVCDSGHPRNAVSRSLNGFLSRDGIHPAELRGICRDQIQCYTSVTFRDVEVKDARRTGAGFEIAMADGERAEARTLLLATGRIDVLPQVEGAAELFGRGLYQCPYCDGWEHRDERIAVYGRGTTGVELALELLDWSADVRLCTDGSGHVSEGDRARLARNGIQIAETGVARFLSDADGMLRGIRFADGSDLACTAVFFFPDQYQRSPFPEQLGCTLDEEGSVVCEGHVATGIPGLYVAGNASRGLQLAIIAAAEGTEAAFAINTALSEEDCQRRAEGRCRD